MVVKSVESKISFVFLYLYAVLSYGAGGFVGGYGFLGMQFCNDSSTMFTFDNQVGKSAILDLLRQALYTPFPMLEDKA